MGSLLRCVPIAALLLFFIPQTSAALEKVSFEASSRHKGKSIRLRAEIFRPRGRGPFPSVVMMHACGGWSPPAFASLRKHADNFVRNGFLVLNLDSFGPRGNARGVICRDRAQSRNAQLYRAQDAFDARAFLAARPDVDARNIFLMGQSHGANVAVQIADRGSVVSAADPERNFRAAVAYYPFCLPKIYPMKLGIPLMIFGAELHDWTPVQGCRDLKMQGAENELVVYRGALHAFDLELSRHRYLGYLMGYDAAATRDSRKRMVEFFRRHMATDPKPN